MKRIPLTAHLTMPPAYIGFSQHELEASGRGQSEFALFRGQMSSSERTIDDDEFRAHSKIT